MRKALFLLFAAALAMSACGDRQTSREDYAAMSAKSYYDSLVAGGYAYFTDGFVGTDSLPPHYREQLVVNAKQYIMGQKKIHNGVDSVRIVSARTDSVTNVTNVFLMLCFEDSIKEEIVVPMIERNGVWKMK